SRFVRAAVGRLLGGAARRRHGVVQVQAPDVLSTIPPASFCGAALPASIVSDLTSPVLHVEGASISPWTVGEVLRDALGLAFRACGLPLPALLVPADVDRFALTVRGTTTTTLPEMCDGMAPLDPQVVTDPANPGCADFEWITPIPDCAD